MGHGLLTHTERQKAAELAKYKESNITLQLARYVENVGTQQLLAIRQKVASMQLFAETLQCALGESKPPSVLCHIADGKPNVYLQWLSELVSSKVHLSITDNKLSLLFEDASSVSTENKKVLHAIKLV